MNQQRPKQPAEEIQNWTMVFPNQANPNGNMFGGDLLAIMDTTAAMAAKRYSQMDVSTVTVEAVHFAKPFMVGDNIKTTAKVVAVGNSSMMVKAEAFKDIGKNRLKKCVSAYFNLVAFDDNRRPTQVPMLQITVENKQEHEIALFIRESSEQREMKLQQFN